MALLIEKFTTGSDKDTGDDDVHYLFSTDHADRLTPKQVVDELGNERAGENRQKKRRSGQHHVWFIMALGELGLV